MVNLLAGAQVNQIRQGDVRQLLLDLEAADRTRANSRDNRDPFAKRLHGLKIAAASCI